MAIDAVNVLSPLCLLPVSPIAWVEPGSLSEWLSDSLTQFPCALGAFCALCSVDASVPFVTAVCSMPSVPFVTAVWSMPPCLLFGQCPLCPLFGQCLCAFCSVSAYCAFCALCSVNASVPSVPSVPSFCSV